jgi:hypothetical protein
MFVRRQPLAPCRILRLECCDVKTQWQYEVYYVCDGRRVYYEIWRKNLSEYMVPWVRVERGLNAEDGLRMAQQGGGYSFNNE